MYACMYVCMYVCVYAIETTVWGGGYRSVGAGGALANEGTATLATDISYFYHISVYMR